VRPTEAEVANEIVRRHLSAMIVVAQEGSNADVGRLMRSEVCRLASAICTALSFHRLDARGRCPLCDATSCGLLTRVRRALLPVHIGPSSIKEQS
jgi:hypothetical protein